MQRLNIVDLFGDFNDLVARTFQISREIGSGVGFLLEYKGREQGSDLGRFIIGKDIVEDEFGQYELVAGVDLARDLALQLNATGFVDEAKVCQNLDSLLVVREELEVLVGKNLFELVDVLSDEPLVVTHGKLEIRQRYCLQLSPVQDCNLHA